MLCDWGSLAAGRLPPFRSCWSPPYSLGPSVDMPLTPLCKIHAFFLVWPWHWAHIPSSYPILRGSPHLPWLVIFSWVTLAARTFPTQSNAPHSAPGVHRHIRQVCELEESREESVGVLQRSSRTHRERTTGSHWGPGPCPQGPQPCGSPWAGPGPLHLPQRSSRLQAWMRWVFSAGTRQPAAFKNRQVSAEHLKLTQLQLKEKKE